MLPTQFLYPAEAGELADFRDPEEAIEQDERVEVELERPDNVQAPRDPELQYFPENASSEAKLRHQRQGHVQYWSECPSCVRSKGLLQRPDPLWTPSRCSWISTFTAV